MVTSQPREETHPDELPEGFYEPVDLPDEAPIYQQRCARKGCRSTFPAENAAAVMFRREKFCSNCQLLHRITKKLRRQGYGNRPAVRPIQMVFGLGAGPKTAAAARGKAGRPSKKGVWAAAEQVLANIRRATFEAEAKRIAAQKAKSEAA
jgi:hypothetical protein